MNFTIAVNDLNSLNQNQINQTLIISFGASLNWESLVSLGMEDESFAAKVSHRNGNYQLDVNIHPQQGIFDLRWSFANFYRKFSKSLKIKNLLIFAGRQTAEQLLVEDILALHSDHFFTELAFPVSLFCHDAAHQRVFTQRLKLSWSYREWINANADEMTSFRIGDEIRQLGANSKLVEVTSITGEAVVKENLNLLHMVGRASSLSPPMLHIARYRPEQKRRITLIGKGVTFDTGGINVKPYESFVNCMKNDMGGAALAFHIFKHLIESEAEQGVDLLIPCCENAVDEKSMKPGAIVTSHAGHKVFIDHTDSEGRLILADALSYAEKKLGATQTFTLATLTTAALQQYGNFLTPAYFLNSRQQELLDVSGAKFGEEFIHQPFQRWYDLANQHITGMRTNRGVRPAAAAMGARSNVAAHFIKYFAQKDHAHFDIFNTVWNWSGDYPGNPYGATGAPLHSLCEFFGVYGQEK